ncbi:MAG: hypothetical protein ACK5MY_11385 [Jhaorihella sp.]
MHERNIKAAPNYTVPALVMAGVNLLWIFFVVWAAFGFFPALLLAAAINHGIDRLASHRGAQ